MKYVDLDKRENNFNKNFKYDNFKKLAPFIHKFSLNKQQNRAMEYSSTVFLNAAFKTSKLMPLGEIHKYANRHKHQNISTSGILVPKHYCSIEYNLLMRDFYNTVYDLGINIKSWYTSLPIRIKFGDFVPKNFSIQDSGTLHVDSPTGFSTNCFAIFYNLCGDISNNYIKFWKIKKNIKKIPYELLIGEPTQDKLELAMNFIEPVKYKLKRGEILVADNVIYHQTVRNINAGNRISIDNLCEPNFMYGKDEKNKHRKLDLVETKKLINIGKDYIYHYSHTDNQHKKTFGLRSPAHKKEISYK